MYDWCVYNRVAWLTDAFVYYKDYVFKARCHRSAHRHCKGFQTRQPRRIVLAYIYIHIFSSFFHPLRVYSSPPSPLLYRKQGCGGAVPADPELRAATACTAATAIVKNKTVDFKIVCFIIPTTVINTIWDKRRAAHTMLERGRTTGHARTKAI
jgi:hypothetical protein